MTLLLTENLLLTHTQHTPTALPNTSTTGTAMLPFSAGAYSIRSYTLTGNHLVQRLSTGYAFSPQMTFSSV